ncbi:MULTISPECIES: RNA methyltransferase [Asticcacaulis]|uniref:TrmH family RNA methyltransferase n=1 Tax=Asticcacaulis TaxID=76890 RepID=UPI001AE28056|nr:MULTISPECIES: RNA methyltransferase [Asticcacaulis]MBP2158428.1 TrmH family RNA methyltransferase [Asticcacaulis solisilvae]MDR6799473.1 TrmH family RNA methyltransferase [Asticcacaulis sp. BE141]
MIKQITSLTNQTVKDIRALHMRKEREATGRFLSEGLKIIIDALDQGITPLILVYGVHSDPHPLQKRAIEETLKAGGEVLEVTREILEKISRKDNPQMVVAVFAQRVATLKDIDPDSNDVWVALEQVRDPGNLGTIIRTADAAGIGGVILIGDCVDPFSVETVRATMGSVFALPIVKCTREEFLADRGRWTGSVVGTLLTARHDHRSAPYRRPTLIVMGTEQSGLTPDIAATCDTNVKIPMRGRADSLNLSVATGIMIYAACGL